MSATMTETYQRGGDAAKRMFHQGLHADRNLELYNKKELARRRRGALTIGGKVLSPTKRGAKTIVKSKGFLSKLLGR